ncbi:MAG: winged helix-turn-helix transcriptional regulator [Balneolaceae bacterium]|nr:winged helix-turn-helix transcriptional regulator [Balneolaceae bacterium]MCH8548657.1 SatD family protein [Balneolaceae bacterium]
MYTAITGDIVASKKAGDPDIWQKPLKKLFSRYGRRPSQWEIYRGDSFQLQVENREALKAAILIKATIRKIGISGMDVRLALGLGSGDGKVAVNESSDEAFIYSGRLLDELKGQKIHMGFRSPWEDLNREINMMMRLSLVIMNSWTESSAATAELLFSEPSITQIEIAERLGIAQSSVSDRIRRGSIHEIIEFEKYYSERIEKITGS